MSKLNFISKVILVQITTTLFALTYSCGTAKGTVLVSDSLYRTIYYTNNNFMSLGQLPNDTSIDGFQRYYRVRNTLGNLGLPQQDMFKAPDISGSGFIFGNNFLDDYVFSTNNIRYYNTKSPYTKMDFSLGKVKEQSVGFIHSQNVNEKLNFTVNFKRIRSSGFYANQNTNNNNFYFSSNYRYRKRYYLLASVYINSLKHVENGGVLSDSIFENNPPSDKRLLAVNLLSANSYNSYNGAFLKQYFVLGEKNVKDSLGKFTIEPSSFFLHSCSVIDRMYKYQDDSPLSGFYSNVFYDSVMTRDSTRLAVFENTLEYRMSNLNRDGKSRILGFSIEGRHQLVKILQASTDSTQKYFVYTDSLMNIPIAYAEIFGNVLKGKIFWNAFFEKGLFSNNSERIRYGASVIAKLKDTTNFFKVSFNYKVQPLNYIYQRFYSNHFRWNANVGNTYNGISTAMFNSNKYFFQTGIEYYQFYKIAFFDSTGNAKYDDGRKINIMSLYVKKRFNLWKFHNENNIRYQRVDNIDLNNNFLGVPPQSIYNVPSLILSHSLYFEDKIFKKSMHFQLGVDFFYNTAYYADAYMPATGQFIVQNNRKIGGYPYFDVFLNFRVKTVRCFVKYEHLNSGMNGYSYYFAPQYPYADRAIKIGLTWVFFD